MITDSAPPPAKKITLGGILGWIWFVFAGIGGLAEMGTGSAALGIFSLLSGIAACPATWNFLKSRLGIDVSGWARLALVIGMLMLAGYNAPKAREGESRPATAMSAPAPAPAAAANPPRTLLDLSGSGTKTTAKFTTQGDDWDLSWSYNCSNFGQQGNFQVDVKTGDGGFSGNAGVNQLGMSGSDVEHFHTGGTFYLVMNSECTWHITVTG